MSATSLNVINELSIGEQKAALNIFTNDAFDAMLGETMTSSSIGKLYDALGKPNDDKIKQKIIKSTEIKKSK